MVTIPDAEVLIRRRKEAATTIAHLRQQAEDATPGLLAAVEAAEGRFTLAKTAMEVAAQDLQRAKADLSSLGNEYLLKIGGAEAFLTETAPPEIDVLIDAFQAAWDELRRHGYIASLPPHAKRATLSWPRNLTEESNPANVRAVLAYCRSAIASLHLLKLEPVLIPRKIQQLIDGVLAVDGHAESTDASPTTPE
jgi:hypothetical protein